tara:strand:- start:206 stop:493 length:288 start_codon:yes stop_codon:yes gene_type:complete
LKRERDRLIEVSKNLKISINKFEKQHVMESMKFSDGGMGATLGKPGIGTGAFKIPQNDSVPDSNYHSRQGSNMRDLTSPGPKGTIDSAKRPNTET